MKNILLAVATLALSMGIAFAEDRGLEMSVNPNPALVGNTIRFVCTGTGEWDTPIVYAEVTIWNASNKRIARGQTMQISGLTATFDYTIPEGEESGEWDFRCKLYDGDQTKRLN